jgi:hypothetical protein
VKATQTVSFLFLPTGKYGLVLFDSKDMLFTSEHDLVALHEFKFFHLLLSDLDDGIIVVL